MALRDLLVKFGVDVEGKQKIDAVDDSLKATLRSANAFGRTMKQVGSYLLVGAIVRGVKEFIVGQMQQADALKHNAERLGVTSDEMQKYEYVSGIVGVSAQQTAVGFRFLDRAVGEAALGTKSATKVFAQLGVNIYEQGTKNIKPTSEIIMELSDAFKKTPSQAIRVALAMRTLGRGGSSLLPMLQKGSVELKQMFDKVELLGGGFNEAFVDAAHDADEAMRDLKMGMRSVFVAVATELLPVFKRWVDKSIKNVKVMIDYAKHTYGIRTAIMALTAATVIAGVYRLAKAFGIGRLGVKDFLKSFLQNAALVAFVAIVTALYLAFDDFYTLMQGGDSVLGRFLDHFGGAGTAKKFVEDLTKAFEDLQATIGPVAGELSKISLNLLTMFAKSIPDIIRWSGIFGAKFIGQILAAITVCKQLYDVNMALGNLMSGNTEAAKYWWEERKRDSAHFEDQVAGLNGVLNVVDSMGKPQKTPEVGYSAYTPQRASVDPNMSTMTREPIKVIVNQNNNFSSSDGAAPGQLSKATAQGVKDGLAEHRDTYDAVGAGMPAWGPP